MPGRSVTCCFTGHRPEKLPLGRREEDARCRALKARLWDAVETAYEEGMRHFICGMAGAATSTLPRRCWSFAGGTRR